MMFYKRHTSLKDKRGDMQNLMNVTLMMIILAFFIVLNSLSVPSDPKRKAALGSLIGTLGALQGGISPMSLKKGVKGVVAKYSPVTDKQVTMSMMLDKFEQFVVAKDMGKKTQSKITKGGLELTLQSALLFDEGTVHLTSKGSEVLDALADLVKRLPGRFSVESYTSEKIAWSDSFATPVDLTIARSGFVARKLIKSGKVNKKRVSIAGYGAVFATLPEDTQARIQANDHIRIVYKLGLLSS